MSSQPYVLHSAEGRPVAAPLGGNDTGEFDSFITHPWRKYCTTRWEFLPRFIPLFTFAFTILVMVLVIDGKLKVHAGVYQRTAVNGYSALEQAGSTERVRNILRAWSPTQRLMAAFSSGLHFLFTFLYVAVITMACCWGANHCPYKAIGDALAWLQLFGGFFDIILQSCCAYMAIHGPTTGLPELSLACVIIHLIVLVLGALYFVVARIGHWIFWSDISRRGPFDDKVY